MCGSPARVYVALGAIQAHGLVAQRNEPRRLEVAGLARLNLWIAGLLHDERQPSDLELGAGGNDQIGAARAGDEARLSLHVVRILEPIRGDIHIDLVAAELLHERAPLRNRREDVERAPCGHGGRQEECQEKVTDHDHS